MDFGGFILFIVLCLLLLAGLVVVGWLFNKKSRLRGPAASLLAVLSIVTVLFGCYLHQVYWLDEPLWGAAYSGDTVQVRTLLAAGADPNAQWEDGSTAMAAARRSGNLEIVAILKRAGGHE